MRVLVTGSRAWEDADVITRVLELFCPDDSDHVLIHGAARGADTIAGRIAAQMNMDVKADPCTPAEWKEYGKAAGARRNQRMVDSKPDVCIAFPRGKASGTRDCISRAIQAGIPTYVVWESGRIDRANPWLGDA